MKKFQKLLTILVAICCLFALAACGEEGTVEQTTAAATTAAAANTSAPDNTAAANTSAAEGEKSVLYKDTMVPYDQLEATEHIVILQNTMFYGRDGFYTEETAPVATEIEYGDGKTDAYAMTYALDFLSFGYEDGVTVYDTADAATEFSAEAIAGCFVIIDLMSDEAPVLYNPADKTSIAFKYLTTAKGEGIYSIVSGTTHNCQEVVELFGWALEGEFRYIATDKFHIPVPVLENSTGELRGTLSGAVNGSFPTLSIASGKINDVVLIAKIPAGK